MKRRSLRPGPHSGASAELLRLDRRSLLRGGVGAVALGGLAGVAAACGGDTDTTTEGVSAGPEVNLAALFPRDVAYLAAGVPSRLVYTLVDAEGIPASSIPGPLEFRISFDGEAVGEPVEVAPRGDGVPRPYLPVPVVFPRPGIYDVDTVADGVELNSQVQVFDPTEIEQPLVGQVLPPAATPTTQQSFDVNPICTLNPQCPFHETDLQVALEGDLPVVVLLATPAYCQTTACGPILDLLVDEAGGRSDLVVIHAEVYKDPKSAPDLAEAALAPLPLEYEMPFEPSLFVSDAAHEIVARGDIVVDRGEMAEMLALAV